MNNVVRDVNDILDGVTVVIKKILPELKINYTEEGTVIRKNDDGTYKVRINGGTTDIKSLHGVEYNANDVVYILIINQDFSTKFILDKKY